MEEGRAQFGLLTISKVDLLCIYLQDRGKHENTDCGDAAGSKTDSEKYGKCSSFAASQTIPLPHAELVCVTLS